MLRMGSTYHIYNRGNNSETIYKDNESYSRFLSICRMYILPVAEIHAWCLMPNHFHFLAKIRSEENQYEYFCEHQGPMERTEPYRRLNPSRRFATAFSTYAMMINRKFDRTGSLFQDCFRRKEVLKDAYLQHVVHYIHFNPVKHGYVDNAIDYRWSSLNAYLEGRIDNQLSSFVEDVFPSREAYMASFGSKTPMELSVPELSSHLDNSKTSTL